MRKVGKLTGKYILWMVLLSSLCIGIFILISKWITKNKRITFDYKVISYVQSFVADNVTIWINRLTFLGSIQFVIVSALVIAVFLFIYKKKALVIFFLFSNGIGGLLNIGLKWYIKRERPDILPVITEQGYSFPSGHSMGALIFYGSLAYICIHLVRSVKKRIFFYIGTVVLIVSIGISRIYLGVHYPTDIIGGFSIGFAYLLLCILAFRYYEERNNR